MQPGTHLDGELIACSLGVGARARQRERHVVDGVGAVIVVAQRAQYPLVLRHSGVTCRQAADVKTITTTCTVALPDGRPKQAQLHAKS